MLAVGFLKMAFIKLRIPCSHSLFVKYFFHERVLDFVRCFLVSFDRILMSFKRQN